MYIKLNIVCTTCQNKKQVFIGIYISSLGTPVTFDFGFEIIYFLTNQRTRSRRYDKRILIYLPYAYTCDVVKYYSFFQIKIKINENFSLPMISFAELGVEDIASFCFCNFASLHGS